MSLRNVTSCTLSGQTLWLCNIIMLQWWIFFLCSRHVCFGFFVKACDILLGWGLIYSFTLSSWKVTLLFFFPCDQCQTQNNFTCSSWYVWIHTIYIPRETLVAHGYHVLFFHTGEENRPLNSSFAYESKPSSKKEKGMHEMSRQQSLDLFMGHVVFGVAAAFRTYSWVFEVPACLAKGCLCWFLEEKARGNKYRDVGRGSESFQEVAISCLHKKIRCS
jgi:hypothetical protein